MRSLLEKPVVILTLLGVLLLLPSLLFGPAPNHSHFYNILWTDHFGRQMAAGHLYERWLPNSFEGLGSPTFYFYPPIAYWVSGAFNAAGFSVGQAINLAGLVLLVGSGLAMHAFLAGRVKHPLLGAALYMAAPYHLYDFYVRGALAEFAAFLWLPLIALAIERLPGRRGVMMLALTFAGLLLTHLPIAMLTGLFLIAPLMVRRVAQDRTALPAGIVAGLLAFSLAAFYLLPALTLQDRVSMNLLWNPIFSATAWSIWRAGSEVFTAIALAALLLAWPARSIWTGIAVFAALASIRLIPFLWEIDLLNKVQFPWRALCIAEFAAVVALMHYRPRPVLLTAALLPLALAYYIVGGVSYAMLRLPTDYDWVARTGPDAPEYLPYGFNSALVSDFDRTVNLSSVRRLSRDDRMMVEQAGPVTFGRSAFPIWRVMHDGRTVETHGPLLHFQATPGLYRIERVRIWQEQAGAAISLACAILLAGLTLRDSRGSGLPRQSDQPEPGR